MISTLIVSIVLMAGQWRVFQKMGRRGWEGIIPGYNFYILFDMLYQNGWKVFMLLIPIYNIILLIRLHMDLAERFNKSRGFGVGMALLAPVFYCIVGFGSAKYLDGSQAVQGTDPISVFLEKIAGLFNKNEA